ncbi:diguanylate cyclase [Desulfonema magnum]|uniref:diguanylate cyclase n=1 Tax=Desulfonema magnum TaxID=45655 RepID=A0A975BLM4_9BACT|nr:diguanylate cyclase [Desulfonema magnum]QTA87393.1 Two component system response regulator, GGDEF domain-containing [Desulfonema magnum]
MSNDTKKDNILIVDDASLNIEMVANILRKEGYQMFFARNGETALGLTKSVDFDLILLDIVMPEMDGYKVCEILKQNTKTKDVPVIFLTAKTDTESIVKGFETGGVDYIGKPFNPPELLARVKTHLQLRHAYEEIKLLSITDSLTGCYNRSSISERLPREIQRARRYNRSLSLILCDIDYFKKVNDTYGHQAGDQTLKKFVQYIQGMIRQKIDWVARYGGEEFLIVLPETDIRGAHCLAERIRIYISKSLIQVQKNEIRITSSFGVTGFNSDTPHEIISVENIIRHSDKYLYQAKKEGRNRVKTGPLRKTREFEFGNFKKLRLIKRSLFYKFWNLIK